MVHPARLARASRFVVTQLGLSTASRRSLVFAHRSGVLVVTHMPQGMCSGCT